VISRTANRIDDAEKFECAMPASVTFGYRSQAVRPHRRCKSGIMQQRQQRLLHPGAIGGAQV
jgi:hypothetical protein